jgi:deoxyribodipyrimidine photolyase-like uncharacterized protein
VPAESRAVKTLVLILGDQLSRDLSALDGFDLKRDVVLMVEVAEETTYVPHHKQKIAFILSAMRHFARGAARGGAERRLRRARRSRQQPAHSRASWRVRSLATGPIASSSPSPANGGCAG